MFITSVAID